MLNNVLEHAVELHNGKLTPEKAKEVELERERVAFSLVHKVCRYANEFLDFSKLKRFSQMEFEEKNGYSPERYLIGALRTLYSRSMNGHGSEAKAVSILYGNEIILDQTFTRTRDHLGGIFNPISDQREKIEVGDDGIHITFENFPFYPKSPEHSSELPGYYKVEILISRDEVHNDSISCMAEDRCKDLEVMSG